MIKKKQFLAEFDEDKGGESTRNRWRGSLLFFKTFMSVPSLTNICKHTKENTFTNVKIILLLSLRSRESL